MGCSERFSKNVNRPRNFVVVNKQLKRTRWIRVYIDGIKYIYKYIWKKEKKRNIVLCVKKKKGRKKREKKEKSSERSNVSCSQSVGLLCILNLAELAFISISRRIIVLHSTSIKSHLSTCAFRRIFSVANQRFF